MGGQKLWSGHWQATVNGVGAVYGANTKGIVALTHPAKNNTGYDGKTDAVKSGVSTSTSAPTPSGSTQNPASDAETESKPQTLEDALNALVKGFETGMKGAFAKGLGMTSGEAALRPGLSRPRGEAAASAIKQKAMISQIAPEATAGNLYSVQEKSKAQAQRKKDQEMTPAVVPIMKQQTAVQHVINNQGGGPQVVWTKPSPMVAPF